MHNQELQLPFCQRYQ